MTAAVLLLLCLTVPALTFAQQELPLGAEETGAIYEKLQKRYHRNGPSRGVHYSLLPRVANTVPEGTGAFNRAIPGRNEPSFPPE